MNEGVAVIEERGAVFEGIGQGSPAHVRFRENVLASGGDQVAAAGAHEEILAAGER